MPGLELRVEEGEQRLLGATGIVPLEAVPRPFQGEKLGLDARRFQAIDEPGRLLERDVGVLGALDAERGRAASGPPP
jgi:hypothetical protein